MSAIEPVQAKKDRLGLGTNTGPPLSGVNRCPAASVWPSSQMQGTMGLGPSLAGVGESVICGLLDPLV